MTLALALLLRHGLRRPAQSRGHQAARLLLAHPECWPDLETRLAQTVPIVQPETLDGDIVIPCSPTCDRETWPEGPLGTAAWCLYCGPLGLGCISASECFEGEE